MPSYQKILLATDFSAAAADIAKKARMIASENEAELHVIHVIEHSAVVYGGEFSVPINVQLQQEIEVKVREALAKMATQLNISDEQIHLQEGVVATEVTKLADQLDFDLIVVGREEPHGIKKLLGSRANAILHEAPCDVLVLKV